jgi:chromosome segregation ATPase
VWAADSHSAEYELRQKLEQLESRHAQICESHAELQAQLASAAAAKERLQRQLADSQAATGGECGNLRTHVRYVCRPSPLSTCRLLQWLAL